MDFGITFGASFNLTSNNANSKKIAFGRQLSKKSYLQQNITTSWA